MSELKPCPFTDSEVARKLRTWKGYITTPGLDELVLWAADIIDRRAQPDTSLITADVFTASSRSRKEATAGETVRHQEN